MGQSSEKLKHMIDPSVIRYFYKELFNQVNNECCFTINNSSIGSNSYCSLQEVLKNIPSLLPPEEGLLRKKVGQILKLVGQVSLADTLIAMETEVNMHEACDPSLVVDSAINSLEKFFDGPRRQALLVLKSIKKHLFLIAPNGCNPLKRKAGADFVQPPEKRQRFGDKISMSVEDLYGRAITAFEACKKDSLISSKMSVHEYIQFEFKNLQPTLQFFREELIQPTSVIVSCFSNFAAIKQAKRRIQEKECFDPIGHQQETIGHINQIAEMQGSYFIINPLDSLESLYSAFNEVLIDLHSGYPHYETMWNGKEFLAVLYKCFFEASQRCS